MLDVFTLYLSPIIPTVIGGRFDPLVAAVAYATAIALYLCLLLYIYQLARAPYPVAPAAPLFRASRGRQHAIHHAPYPTLFGPAPLMPDDGLTFSVALWAVDSAMAVTEFGTKSLSVPMLGISKAFRVPTLVKTHVRCLTLRFPTPSMTSTDLMHRYAGPTLFVLMLFSTLASVIGASTELASLANFTCLVLVAGDRKCVVEGEDDGQDEAPVEAEQYHVIAGTSLPMMGTDGHVVTLQGQV
ncbi:hypothetical protein RhiJN_20531 [Ceratobasidium sp. AG-Ba]|nr:hypothetical protein RhiJN_20531 [Ceratobasidium sp. AG-Ba]